MASKGEVVREGFLVKKPKGFLKGKKTRWFKLTTCGLYYFGSSSDSEYIGMIELRGLQVEKLDEVQEGKSPKYCIFVTQAPSKSSGGEEILGKPYTLICESEASRDAWVMAICRTRDCLSSSASQSASSSSARDSVKSAANHVSGCLSLNLLEASGLAPREGGAAPSPFALIFLGSPPQQFVSSVCPSTTTPHWDEDFALELNRLPVDAHLLIWDDLKASEKFSFKGYVRIPLGEIPINSSIDVCCPLSGRTKRETVSGEVRIRMRLNVSSNQLRSGAPKCFGLPLPFLMRREDHVGRVVPVLIQKTLEWIHRRGLNVEGLFRIAGLQERINELKFRIDNGEDVDFLPDEDAHVVTALLKGFLRELPEPLLTFELYPKIVCLQLHTLSKESSIAAANEILSRIPPIYLNILTPLCMLLHSVQEKASTNKMTSGNLAVVFGPVLCRMKTENLDALMTDMKAVIDIVSFLITNAPVLFPRGMDMLQRVLNEADENKAASMQRKLAAVQLSSSPASYSPSSSGPSTPTKSSDIRSAVDSPSRTSGLFSSRSQSIHQSREFSFGKEIGHAAPPR